MDFYKILMGGVGVGMSNFDRLFTEKYGSSRKKEHYGWHVNPDIESPDDAVTYLLDAVGKNPGSMGNTSFDYGDWADAFFVKNCRPCMLGFDGKVKYYIDPNDYSKKLDGTRSDYDNLDYNGNVMVEFPLIWWKYEAGEAEGEGYFYVANYQVDKTYHCWSNINSQNEITPTFYMAAYNGCAYNGKLRSISGLKLSSWPTTAYSASATYAVGAMVNYSNNAYRCITAVETAEAFDPDKWEQYAYNGNATGQQELDATLALNTHDSSEWYMGVLADRLLICGLLTLVSKSLNSQAKYGRGIDSGSQAAKENYVAGKLDDKGLFWGVASNGNNAVKVFGMENFWGCSWHRTAGLVGASNGYRYKLTYGTADGSTANGYNTNGTNYMLCETTKPVNGYVSKMIYGKWGFAPKSVTGGSQTKYYSDSYWNGNGFALFGGDSDIGVRGGAFCLDLGIAFGYRYWCFGAFPSCKPLV